MAKFRQKGACVAKRPSPNTKRGAPERLNAAVGGAPLLLSHTASTSLGLPVTVSRTGRQVRPALMRGHGVFLRRRGRAANSLAFVSSGSAALTAAPALIAAREIARDAPGGRSVKSNLSPSLIGESDQSSALFCARQRTLASTLLWRKRKSRRRNRCKHTLSPN